MPDRYWQDEQRLEQAVQWSRGQQVGASDNVGDALGGVIDHDGEMVGNASVATSENDVADFVHEPSGIKSVGAPRLWAGFLKGEMCY